MKACYRGCAIIILAAVIWLSLLEPYERIAAAKPAEPIRLTITVRVEEQAGLSSSLMVDSLALSRGLKHTNWQSAAVKPPLCPDVDLTVRIGASVTELKLTKDGALWNETTRQLLTPPPQTSQLLISLVQSVRSQYYGRRLAWEEAKKLIPNKTIFTVTDLQTGLSFRVQRRAGSDHADVQPIAKEDTRIMKQIFDGEWTWKRRAILVRTDQDWIAASMNGMPHGGDGIPDNDFSGHFCIHFYLSTTHKSETPDLAHQLMVHKASGDLRPYLDGADPTMLARSYIEGLNHKDRTVIRQVIYGMQEEQIESILRAMDTLESIRDTTKRDQGHAAPSNEWDQQLTAQVSLPIAYRMQGGSQRNDRYRFTFSRDSTTAPWRLHNIDSGKSRSNERTAS
ncbi:hypothetical protein [Paenibacillus kobensis]|uniref:hypothetical protein n=1 Tax=Paenibacillus kobensis TaxID=59841 RepID=UPI000FDA4620|nr:hypothetical protein [Paenibacillus kobensis]